MIHRLTQRRRQMLDYIRRYTAEHGCAPAIRDICDGCGISSTSVVIYNLRWVADQGYIQRDEGRARAIVLVEES